MILLRCAWHMRCRAYHEKITQMSSRIKIIYSCTLRPKAYIIYNAYRNRTIVLFGSQWPNGQVINVGQLLLHMCDTNCFINSMFHILVSTYSTPSFVSYETNLEWYDCSYLFNIKMTLPLRPTNNLSTMQQCCHLQYTIRALSTSCNCFTIICHKSNQGRHYTSSGHGTRGGGARG